MKRYASAWAGAAALLFMAGGPAAAQTSGADPSDPAPFGPPVADQHVYVHVLADQLETRVGSGSPTFFWEAEGWIGSDWNRLWLKSEGDVRSGDLEESRQELLYSWPILPFFDGQAGLRYDVGSGDSGRGWLALGVEGLVPLWFHLEATVYAGDAGRVAGRIRTTYEMLLTQRLILQPEIELNFFGQSDRDRRTGPGLADLDAGLRLRYEFSRKFAPYLGVTYNRVFGKTASFFRTDGERVDHLRAVFGVRGWL